MTVQDGGRFGYRAVGVPQSGAFDRWALWAANLLVGNAWDAAAIEVLLTGLALRVLRPIRIALTGGDMGATLDDVPLVPWTRWQLASGQLLAFTQRHWGARAYVGVEGGLAVEAVLGSRSTYLAGGWGGFHGRSLLTGDILPAFDAVASSRARWLPPEQRLPYSSQPTLRCLAGPHNEVFDDATLALFTAEPYKVSVAANRMGYRLEGATLVVAEGQLPSLGVLPGVVQVPPSGQPILLGVDAQTTGGYPIIAVVCAADMPLVAQLVPGDQVRFRWLSRAQAVDALRIQSEGLREAWEVEVEGVPI